MVEVRTVTGNGKISKIEALLDLGGEIDIAVAYIDIYGLKLVEDRVKADQRDIRKVRLLVDLKSKGTHPDAVRRMVELSQQCPDRFYCKEYYISEHPYAILHSKLLISENGDSMSFLTGSSNLTQNALDPNRNREHGILVDCRNDPDLAERTKNYFNSLWDDKKRAVTIKEERAIEYERNYRKSKNSGSDDGDLLPPISVNCWLLKANVYIATFEELCAREDKTDMWNGIRQPQARNYMRDEMRIGDLVLFYHTGSGPPEKLKNYGLKRPEGTVRKAVVGTAIVVSEPCADSSAWDPDWKFSELFLDPSDNPDNPKWVMVAIQAEESFTTNPVTLDLIGLNPKLRALAKRLKGEKDSGAAKQATLLKLCAEEYAEILRMGTGEQQP